MSTQMLLVVELGDFAQYLRTLPPRGPTFLVGGAVCPFQEVGSMGKSSKTPSPPPHNRSGKSKGGSGKGKNTGTNSLYLGYIKYIAGAFLVPLAIGIVGN